MTVRIRRIIVGSCHTVPPAGMLAPPRLLRWLLPLLVLSGLLVASAAQAQSELYVTNQQGELKTTAPDSVVVYELASTGDLTFKRILTGPSTKLSVPSGLAVTQDKLFVANQGKCVVNQAEEGENQGDDGCITIYSRTASDDTSPTWIIGGSKTGLNRPFGLVVKDDELFVANQTATVGRGSITVYKLKDALGVPTPPKSGKVLNITPNRTIEGPLSGPSFIVVTDNELFVANNYSGIVTVHDRNGTGNQMLRSFKNTGFQPFYFPLGLAINDTHTELFLAHGFFEALSFSISVYKPDVTDPSTPLRILNGAETKLDHPSGLVLSGEHLVVANQANTNRVGSIAVFDRTFSQREPVVRPPYTDNRLFSPVSLALAPGLSFDYALKVGNVPLVAAGSVVDIKITAELLAGSGTVISLSVEGLPGGAFNPKTCPLSCDTTLTIAIPASTALGTYTVTVTAVGAPTGCNAAECTVERFVSFPLVVGNPPVLPQGILEVVKAGDGTGTVRSRLPDDRINCGLVCSTPFPVGTVELTATADAGSNFGGWSVPNCVPTQPCRVNIIESTTTRVTAFFDKIPPVPLNVTVNYAGTGTGTVTGNGISCKPTCSVLFPPGTVTLTANPDSSSSFAGWSQPAGSNLPRCGGTESCSITITKDTIVNAFFARTPQEAFIAGLYLNVFVNPPPSPSDVQALIDALTPLPTLTIDALMDAFFNGPAFKDRFRNELTPSGYVSVLFRAFFRREPSRDVPPGQLRSIPEQIIEFLFDSIVRKLIGLAGPASTGKDVASLLYQTLLNRAPTPTERDRLQPGLSGLPDATLRILSSVEYEQLRISGISIPGIGNLNVGISEDVRRLYGGLLGREPNIDIDEVGSEIDQLLRRAEIIEDAFAGSAEFKTRFGQLFP
jgi:hypothetical protein